MTTPAPRPLPARERRIESLAERAPEVVVVGGGITGAGIAHDLALRGVRVALLERGDWAHETSSASSSLVHGGLRYLETGEVGLVRESCLERALLLRNAAGLVWPERFTFPVHRGARVGRAKLAAGLLAYTLVSIPRVLGLPHLVGRRAVAARVPGIRAEGLRGGGDYLDGATDDARLTLAVVLSAIEAGAVAVSRVEVDAVGRGSGGAAVDARDLVGGETMRIEARAVVLAGGPGTDELRARAGLSGSWVRPTRGSHLVVRRERLPTDGAVIFPSPLDGRVMFLIPRPRATVVGTTDLDAEPPAPAGTGGGVRATRTEVDYLLRSANGLVPAASLREEDVVSTWAGLRPLLASGKADPSARSREERVERDGPLYTIAGGKLTGYRVMAEKLCARIVSDLGTGSPGRISPTRATRLWGALETPAARPAWSQLDDPAGEPVLVAWSRRYAGHSRAVEDACLRAPEGRSPLSEETLLGEVDWAVRYEDCQRAEDFLLRRTGLGSGPREASQVALEAVLERMARLLGWGAERRAAEQAGAEEALDLAGAWVRDPAP